MRASRQSVLPLLALAVSLAGCDSPLSPKEAAGEYALHTSVVLPVAPNVNVLIADTIALGADGHGMRTSVISRADEFGARTVERQTQTFRYRIEGGAIGLLYDCPPETACVAMARRVWYDVGKGASALRAREGSRHRYGRVTD
jgi:hypothetical protein